LTKRTEPSATFRDGLTRRTRAKLGAIDSPEGDYRFRLRADYSSCPLGLVLPRLLFQ
jgi:hypothetical protein